MTDWLEEIEGDARLHTHVGNTTATGGGPVVIVGKADLDRLLAEVRALRAQVAAQKGVVEAATAFRGANRALRAINSLPPMPDKWLVERREAIVRMYTNSSDALDAALADAEGEGWRRYSTKSRR